MGCLARPGCGLPSAKQSSTGLKIKTLNDRTREAGSGRGTAGPNLNLRGRGGARPRLRPTADGAWPPRLSPPLDVGRAGRGDVRGRGGLRRRPGSGAGGTPRLSVRSSARTAGAPRDVRRAPARATGRKAVSGSSWPAGRGCRGVRTREGGPEAASGTPFVPPPLGSGLPLAARGRPVRPRAEGEVGAPGWKAVLTEVFQSRPRCRRGGLPSPDRGERGPGPLRFRGRAVLRELDLPQRFRGGACSVPVEMREPA